MANYVVKCFDDSDNCALSLVVTSDDLFKIVDYYKSLYKVKAFVLTESEVM